MMIIILINDYKQLFWFKFIPYFDGSFIYKIENNYNYKNNNNKKYNNNSNNNNINNNNNLLYIYIFDLK